jgi:hypothetical protein
VMALIIIVMCTFAFFGATAFRKSPRFENFEASVFVVSFLLLLTLANQEQWAYET